MQYRNARQGMVSSLQPTSVRSYISLRPDLGFIDHCLYLKVQAAMAYAEIRAELVCPLGHPAFNQERAIMIPRDMTSLKEKANA